MYLGDSNIIFSKKGDPKIIQEASFVLRGLGISGILDPSSRLRRGDHPSRTDSSFSVPWCIGLFRAHEFKASLNPKP